HRSPIHLRAWHLQLDPLIAAVFPSSVVRSPYSHRMRENVPGSRTKRSDLLSDGTRRTMPLTDQAFLRRMNMDRSPVHQLCARCSSSLHKYRRVEYDAAASPRGSNNYRDLWKVSISIQAAECSQFAIRQRSDHRIP